MPEDHPLEICSIRLHPATLPLATILIVGIDIPPDNTKKIKLELPEGVNKNATAERAGVVLPHLIAGDCNTTTSGDVFEKWTTEMGLWRPNGPRIPTITTTSLIAEEWALCSSKQLFFHRMHSVATSL